MSITLILDNIRSNHNVGSIFRTADAFGVEKIYLVGYTPAPIDRFGREVGEILKTALGAEKTVQWESVDSMFELLKKLKIESYQIVALEQDSSSISLRNYKPHEKTALVLGNEVGGIEKTTLNMCDNIIEIAMSGKKESLNVSVAAGIALFYLSDTQ